MKLLYPLLLLPFLAGCPSGKCGDNTQDEKEACDDGNTLDADGCEADCSLPACNNGIKDPGELCFAAPANFGTDTAPTEPATADLNEDGHQDIITANSTGESVSVLLGDGTGNFNRQTDIETNSPSFFIVTADFNDDNNQDIAVSVPSLNQIKIFTRLENGSFASLGPLNAPNTNQLITADFNNDGDQDILASSNDGIALFLNDGTGAGSFQAPRISFIGSNPVIAAADFDGDSNIDVAAGVGGNLILLLGDGVGNLAPQTAQLTGEIQGRISTADFNGDQLPDLAVANAATDGSISLFTNQAGTFTQAQTFSTASPFSLVATDLNQDGTPDIAVASDLDAGLNSHLVTITSDAGAFTSQDPLLIGNVNLRGITASDLNEDNIPDVILTDTSNSRLVLFLSQP